MSIYKGTTLIASGLPVSGLPLFYATYQPHKLNNPSWLCADTYSWQSGDIYVAAYEHLANGITGISSSTETIAETTITYYRLSDDIKIVLPDQVNNLETIYNATGIGFYYILDTTNTRFKLPRNLYGFTGLRTNAGDYVAESLPNITGTVDGSGDRTGFANPSGAFYGVGDNTWGLGQYDSAVLGYAKIGLDASRSSSAYQDNAPVQQRATQAYLYFYVGNTVQNQTAIDAGQITEDLNSKVDLDLSNVTNTGKSTAAGWAMPSSAYEDLTLGASGDYYTAPSNGYLVIDKQSNGANQYIEFISHLQVGVFIPQSGYHGRLSLPVIKGEQIRVLYNAGGTTQMFRFYYAEGSKSEQ